MVHAYVFHGEFKGRGYSYTGSQNVTVTLEATAAAPTFRGFLIQPRMFADDSTVVGQFQEPPVEGDYGYSSCSYREVGSHHRSI